MSNLFKVGELAIIQSKQYPSMNGSETEILEVRFNSRKGIFLYRIDPCPHPLNLFIREKALRKLPPKDEESTWEKGIWQPKRKKVY